MTTYIPYLFLHAFFLNIIFDSFSFFAFLYFLNFNPLQKNIKGINWKELRKVSCLDANDKKRINSKIQWAFFEIKQKVLDEWCSNDDYVINMRSEMQGKFSLLIGPDGSAKETLENAWDSLSL